MKIISNHVVEAIGLVTAILNYTYIKNSRYVYFIPYLAFVLFGELGASYFYYASNLSAFKNWHIYLIVYMVIQIFIGYQFYNILLSEKMKQVTFIGTSILTLMLSVILFFLTDIGNLINFTHGIAGLFFSYIAFFVLYEKLIYSEGLEIRPYHSPDFWFTIGVLFFSVGTSLSYILYFYLRNDNVFFLGMRVYHLLPRICSVVLYNCYAVAIILWRKKALLTASENKTAH
jgi:hypothetical protein